MKLTVYIDMLIITNMIINYFLLKITVAAAGITADIKRLIVSSAIGALFSLSIFFDISFIVSLLIKIVCVILCGYIAFGFGNKRLFIRNIFFFLCANMLFAGAMIMLLQNSRTVYVKNLNFYFSLNPVLLVGCIMALYLVLTVAEIVFSPEKKEYNYNMTVYLNNTPYTASAFYDTGFKLKDILSHRGIMLCSMDFIKNKTDIYTLHQLENFFITGQYNDKNITPVFYQDISDSGMLPAIKPDKVTITQKNKDTELKNIILAVSRQDIFRDCEIIFGKEIFNMIGD